MEFDAKRLEQQMDFCREIDKEKEVFRQSFICSGNRRENDAEHAWHMAIMAFLLQEYANEEVDLLKVMKMILIHDVVEIDAGDTYAYDTENLKTQKAREEQAKKRIFSLLPEDQGQELAALFDEFEQAETPESRFAHAMDNLQPLLLNDSNDGGDWQAHRVSAQQVFGRQEKTRFGSEALYDYTLSVLRKHVRQEHLLPPVPEELEAP